MIRRPPRSTRTDTLFPYTTLFRSRRATGSPVAVLVGYKVAQVSYPKEEPRHVASSPGKEERSEEHTSELQSLMRISYAVFCLKKKKTNKYGTKKKYITTPVINYVYSIYQISNNCEHI